MSSDMSKEEMRLAQKRALGPWLHAWHDPVANIKAFSPCVRLADLHATGEHSLLIADADKKLKVYRGTSLASEHALLDIPSGLAIFYTDANKPQTPSVAVAAGSYVFIYRNLRPYYKFTLPPVDIEQVEQDVWANLRASKCEYPDAISQLNEARDNGINLSTRSMTLLGFTKKEEQDAFITSQKQLPLVQLTVATCMETLNKNSTADRSISSLVIGTESRHIIIMETTGTSILKKFLLPSVPVFLAIQGTYDVEYRIVIGCRNGNIYQIKKGKLLGTVIEMETQVCGLLVLEKSILIGCMDQIVHSYHFKGKKNYSIYLPESITNMELLSMSRIKNHKGILISLASGEIRLYNKKHLIHTLKNPASPYGGMEYQGIGAGMIGSSGYPHSSHQHHHHSLIHNQTETITSLRFGSYGREEGSLIITYKSGGMTIKMLQRTANLDVVNTVPGPPAEQDIPLNVPKKTKLYLEQTQREKDQAVEMHRVFQRELCKLRLNTARNFVKILQEGIGPVSTIGSTSLRLDCKVIGLGPVFKLRLLVKNTGISELRDLPVTIKYNEAIYRVKQSGSGSAASPSSSSSSPSSAPLLRLIPLLLPNVEYTYDIDLECIDPLGAADAVRVFVWNEKSVVPAIAAIVNMPMSEIPEKEEY